jgi:hypothetical protein
MLQESYKTSGDDQLNYDLQTVIEQLIVLNGSKVLLIAHSQGNFYANNAIHAIRNSVSLHWETDQQKARLVSVATPTSLVAGGGAYTTLTSDGLINVIPAALKPNSTNNIPKPGLFDHEFVKHYLKGDLAHKQISTQIKLEIEKLRKIDQQKIVQECENWFNLNAESVTKKSECMTECNSFKVDTANFICHKYCSRFCSCR